MTPKTEIKDLIRTYITSVLCLLLPISLTVKVMKRTKINKEVYTYYTMNLFPGLSETGTDL